MKHALITGISGFAGSHLSELLLQKNIKVFGIAHPHQNNSNINHIKNKVTVYKCDMLKKNEIKKVLFDNNYEYIFHLAAFSSPAESFKDPEKTLNNNITAELNLLELLSAIKSKANILVIGSSEEYGNPNHKSVDENVPFSPESPYAVSKVAQDLLGYQFFLHENLRIVRVRPFNHIGPRQSKHFVVSAFAAQIAQLEKKGGGQMRVGNLNTWRDFTDVRDMVKAYLLALEKGRSGEVYNIGSGKLIKIEKILKMLLSFSNAKIKINIEKNLFKEENNKKSVCDFTKFKEETGWVPQIPISKTLFDTIEYERQALK